MPPAENRLCHRAAGIGALASRRWPVLALLKLLGHWIIVFRSVQDSAINALSALIVTARYD